MLYHVCVPSLKLIPCSLKSTDAARYLLIRLSLRKRGKWHTLPSLERSYGGVIGDEEVISSLVDQLCGRLDVPKRPEHGDMFVDLTIGEDPRICTFLNQDHFI